MIICNDIDNTITHWLQFYFHVWITLGCSELPELTLTNFSLKISFEKILNHGNKSTSIVLLCNAVFLRNKHRRSHRCDWHPYFFQSFNLPEVESSRTSLASRTDFEVLGLEGQVLGLETSNPRKLAYPRLEDSTIFWIVKILWSGWKMFWKTFFCIEIAWKIFVKTFFFWDCLKNFCEDLFFFLESTCACVLGPWPRAFLSLASRVSPWPWPRALCPRLHLCNLQYLIFGL